MNWMSINALNFNNNNKVLYNGTVILNWGLL